MQNAGVYWKNNIFMLSPDDGGEGVGTGVGADTGTDAGASGQDEAADDSAAQIAKLKAELAKSKNALDKATKEAGDYRKQLKSRMSADEAAAEEKRALDEARDAELAEYRKRFAVAETSKKVMALGLDETAAGEVAECLYGAADAESALAGIQKYITAHDKALRLEYSKIPAPSAGNADGPSLTREQLNRLTYKERVAFANEHPEDYNKLMGR